MEPIFLTLHVLGATIWAGGHLILTIGFLPGALRTRDTTALKSFESRYERIGIPALIIQVVTGLYLAGQRVDNVGEWFNYDQRYAPLITVKLILLALTLALALHARLRVLPGFHKPAPTTNAADSNADKPESTDTAEPAPEPIGYLAWHIIAITILGVAFILTGLGVRIGIF